MYVLSEPDLASRALGVPLMPFIWQRRCISAICSLWINLYNAKMASGGTHGKKSTLLALPDAFRVPLMPKRLPDTWGRVLIQW